jgi:hypothetical protein
MSINKLLAEMNLIHVNHRLDRVLGFSPVVYSKLRGGGPDEGTDIVILYTDKNENQVILICPYM